MYSTVETELFNGGICPSKKDKYRRKGKGRRCCLGNRLYSIPCSASYFAV